MAEQVAAFSSLVTTIISLVFILYPPARSWFVALPSEYQTAVKGGVALIIAIASTLLGCAGIIIPPTECAVQPLIEWFGTVVLATVLGFAGATAITTPLIVYRTRSRAKLTSIKK